MQFRSACSGAVSVAGVTIFTTLPLQPTKCNFLRYVCGHRGGRSHDGKPEETERRDASGRVENGRGKNRGRCRIEREREREEAMVAEIAGRFGRKVLRRPSVKRARSSAREYPSGRNRRLL